MGPGTSPPTLAPQRMSDAPVTLESLCSFPARQPLGGGGDMGELGHMLAVR